MRVNYKMNFQDPTGPWIKVNFHDLKKGDYYYSLPLGKDGPDNVSRPAVGTLVKKVNKGHYINDKGKYVIEIKDVQIEFYLHSRIKFRTIKP